MRQISSTQGGSVAQQAQARAILAKQQAPAAVKAQYESNPQAQQELVQEYDAEQAAIAAQKAEQQKQQQQSSIPGIITGGGIDVGPLSVDPTGGGYMATINGTQYHFSNAQDYTTLLQSFNTSSPGAGFVQATVTGPTGKQYNYLFQNAQEAQSFENNQAGADVLFSAKVSPQGAGYVATLPNGQQLNFFSYSDILETAQLIQQGKSPQLYTALIQAPNGMVFEYASTSEAALQNFANMQAGANVLFNETPGANGSINVTIAGSELNFAGTGAPGSAQAQVNQYVQGVQSGQNPSLITINQSGITEAFTSNAALYSYLQSQIVTNPNGTATLQGNTYSDYASAKQAALMEAYDVSGDIFNVNGIDYTTYNGAYSALQSLGQKGSALNYAEINHLYNQFFAGPSRTYTVTTVTPLGNPGENLAEIEHLYNQFFPVTSTTIATAQAKTSMLGSFLTDIDKVISPINQLIGKVELGFQVAVATSNNKPLKDIVNAATAYNSATLIGKVELGLTVAPTITNNPGLKDIANALTEYNKLTYTEEQFYETQEANIVQQKLSPEKVVESIGANLEIFAANIENPALSQENKGKVPYYVTVDQLAGTAIDFIAGGEVIASVTAVGEGASLGTRVLSASSRAVLFGALSAGISAYGGASPITTIESFGLGAGLTGLFEAGPAILSASYGVLKSAGYAGVSALRDIVPGLPEAANAVRNFPYSGLSDYLFSGQEAGQLALRQSIVDFLSSSGSTLKEVGFNIGAYPYAAGILIKEDLEASIPGLTRSISDLIFDLQIRQELGQASLASFFENVGTQAKEVGFNIGAYPYAAGILIKEDLLSMYADLAEPFDQLIFGLQVRSQLLGEDLSKFGANVVDVGSTIKATINKAAFNVGAYPYAGTILLKEDIQSLTEQLRLSISDNILGSDFISLVRNLKIGQIYGQGALRSGFSAVGSSLREGAFIVGSYPYAAITLLGEDIESALENLPTRIAVAKALSDFGYDVTEPLHRYGILSNAVEGEPGLIAQTKELLQTNPLVTGTKSALTDSQTRVSLYSGAWDYFLQKISGEGISAYGEISRLLARFNANDIPSGFTAVEDIPEADISDFFNNLDEKTTTESPPPNIGSARGSSYLTEIAPTIPGYDVGASYEELEGIDEYSVMPRVGWTGSLIGGKQATSSYGTKNVIKLGGATLGGKVVNTAVQTKFNTINQTTSSTAQGIQNILTQSASVSQTSGKSSQQTSVSALSSTSQSANSLLSLNTGLYSGQTTAQTEAIKFQQDTDSSLRLELQQDQDLAQEFSVPIIAPLLSPTKKKPLRIRRDLIFEYKEFLNPLGEKPYGSLKDIKVGAFPEGGIQTKRFYYSERNSSARKVKKAVRSLNSKTAKRKPPKKKNKKQSTSNLEKVFFG